MNEPRVPFGDRDVAPDEKPALVRAVFDRVARRYDLMNDMMSFGVHRLWKDILVTRLNPQPGEILLDVAGGTGDVARLCLSRTRERAVRRAAPPARAIVCDINRAMLEAGARKPALPDLAFICGDAERLPIASESIDAVTIAFGIRNVTHTRRALAEIYRVLKPGGRFVCLEFSHVDIPGFDRLYAAYSQTVIPRLGKLIAGDDAPYNYLVESIRRFPDQKAFARLLTDAGFWNVQVQNLSGGIAALHSGWRI